MTNHVVRRDFSPSRAVMSAVLGVIAGALLFGLMSFLSLWVEAGMAEPFLGVLAVLLLTLLVVLGAHGNYPRALGMTATVLVLMVAGALLGSPSYASGIPTLEPYVLLVHGGRSVIVGSVAGALVAVSALAILRDRRSRRAD